MGVNISGALQQALNNPDSFTDYANEAFSAKTFSQVQALVEAAGGEITSRNSNRMTYAIKRLKNRGVIDMKPFFKASSKAKRKKDGGWYLTIPIAMSSKDIEQNYGRKYYDDIRNKLMSSNSATVSSPLFKDGLSGSSSPLAYQRKSGNITATKQTTMKNGKTRNSYTMFRTVSDKSSPTSWIIGRENAQEEDMSERLNTDVFALMNKRNKE